MKRLVILAVGFLILFVGGGARFAISLALKPIAAELDVPRSTLGLAVALYLIVTSASMFLAGRIADRFGVRLVLLAGLLVSAVGMGLVGLVVEPWQLFAFFGVIFAIGNGVASMTPVSLMVSRAFPNAAGLANGIASAGMSAGQLIIIGGFAVLLAVSARQTAAADHDPALAATGANGLSLRAAAATRQFWLLIGVYALCGLDDFFVSMHVVAFAQDRGVDALLAGHLLAAMGLVGFVGVIIAGAWSDRSGPVAPALASFMLRLATFALIVVDPSPVAIAGFALMSASTFLMTAPLLVVFAREAFGEVNLGTITGL